MNPLGARIKGLIQFPQQAGATLSPKVVYPGAGAVFVASETGQNLSGSSDAASLKNTGARFVERWTQSPRPSVVDQVFSHALDISHPDYRTQIYRGLAINPRFSDVPRLLKAAEFMAARHRLLIVNSLASEPHFSDFSLLYRFMDQEQASVSDRLRLYQEILDNPNFKDMGRIWDFLAENGRALDHETEYPFFRLLGALIQRREFTDFDRVFDIIKTWPMFKECSDAAACPEYRAFAKDLVLAALARNPGFNDFESIFSLMDWGDERASDIDVFRALVGNPQFRDFERIGRLIGATDNNGRNSVTEAALLNPELKTLEQFSEVIKIGGNASKERYLEVYVAKESFVDFDAVLAVLKTRKVRSDRTATEILVVLRGLVSNPGFSAFDDAYKLMSVCEHHLGSGDVVDALLELYKSLARNPNFTDLDKIFRDLRDGDWSELSPGQRRMNAIDVLRAIVSSPHFNHWEAVREIFKMPDLKSPVPQEVLSDLAENKSFQDFSPVVDYTVNGDHGLSVFDRLLILNGLAQSHPQADRSWFRSFVEGIADERLRYEGWKNLAGIADGSLSDTIFEKIKNSPSEEIRSKILAAYAANPQIIPS